MAELTQEIIDNAPEGAMRYNPISINKYLKTDDDEVCYFDAGMGWVKYFTQVKGYDYWYEATPLPEKEKGDTELTQDIIDNAPEGAQRYNPEMDCPYLFKYGSCVFFYHKETGKWVDFPIASEAGDLRWNEATPISVQENKKDNKEMSELTKEIIDNAPLNAKRYSHDLGKYLINYAGTIFSYEENKSSWESKVPSRASLKYWNEATTLPEKKEGDTELTQEIIDNAPKGAMRYSFGKTIDYPYLKKDINCVYSWQHGVWMPALSAIWDKAATLSEFIPLKEGVTNIKREPLPNIDAKKGEKYDQDKPRYDLVPAHAEAELVDVLTFGASKYQPNNWRKVPDAKERYKAAAMRHLAAYRMGETHDLESGKHHLAHAMCCLAFIVELDLEESQ